MWFCTMGGLSKYDGFTFTNYYYSEEDSSTISSSYTDKFFEDSKGRYWVSTNRGFNRFYRETGKFKRYLHDDENEKSLGHNSTRGIAEDSDGKLWIVHGKGVDRFDPEKEIFEHYHDDKFSLLRHDGDILLTKNGDILIMGTLGIFKVDKNNKNLIFIGCPDIKADISLDGRELYQDSYGNVWAGFNRGLAKFNTETLAFEVINISGVVLDVSALIEYPNDILVIGTGGKGLILYSISQDRIINNFNYAPSDPKGISGSAVYSLFVDKVNNLWIGLFYGLNRINPKSQRFPLLENESGVNNLKNFTLHVYQDPLGGYWINTMEGLFYRKNLYDKYISVLHPPDFKSGFNDVRGIEGNENGKVLINVRSNGLYQFDVKKSVITKLGPENLFKDTYIFKIKTDVRDKNILWLTGSEGICKMDKTTYDTIWYHPSNINQSLKSDNITHFEQVQDGRIFFTNGGLLCFFDPKNDKIQVIDTNFKIKGSVHAISIRKNKVWVATTTNLYTFDLKNQAWTLLKRADGVTDLKSVGLQIDNNDVAWSIYGSEITVIGKSPEKTLHYESPTSFVNGIGAISREGFLLFGGASGAILINPNNFYKDTIAPKVVFTGLEIANKPVKLGIEDEFVQKIELDYEDNVFTLKFAALHFLFRKQIKYRYRLEGFDKEWMDSGTEKSVTYTNLRPGNYTFLVEAISEDGIKSDEPLAIFIYIRPPFYLTIPFFFFIGALLFSLIYVYYKINKKALSLSKEKEIAEKNAQYKDMFMSNMSHEIRTPMNAIIGLNKILMDTPLNEKQKKYLDAIQTSGENLLWIVNDILDQAKIESGQYLIVNKPFSIKRLLAKIETLFSYRAEDKNLNFKIILDQSLPDILVGDQVRIFQILTNLLNNAIKFTDAGHVHLQVKAHLKASDVYDIDFCVIDTGIGIPNDKISYIFESFHQLHEKETIGNQGVGLGLSIVKNLVNRLGGHIQVASEVGKGTQISVLLPFEIGKVEEPVGDEQVIIFPSNLKILLVEDTPINQMIAIEFLKKFIPDVVIDIAQNGSVAIDRITSNHYDLVLMDVKMPVMNGIDATKAIRMMEGDYYQKVPILGLTASAIPYQVKSCEEAGMNDVITKPINANELILKMNNLFRR